MAVRKVGIAPATPATIWAERRRSTERGRVATWHAGATLGGELSGWWSCRHGHRGRRKYRQCCWGSKYQWCGCARGLRIPMSVLQVPMDNLAPKMWREPARGSWPWRWPWCYSRRRSWCWKRFCEWQREVRPCYRLHLHRHLNWPWRRCCPINRERRCLRRCRCRLQCCLPIDLVHQLLQLSLCHRGRLRWWLHRVWRQPWRQRWPFGCDRNGFWCCRGRCMMYWRCRCRCCGRHRCDS